MDKVVEIVTTFITKLKELVNRLLAFLHIPTLK